MAGLNGSWGEYQKLVLHELKELRIEVKEIKSEQVEIRTSIAMLKFKASLAGGLAGFIFALALKFLN